MATVHPSCNVLQDQVLDMGFIPYMSQKMWVNVRSKSRMLSLFRIGAFVFCSRLRNTVLYFSGTSSAVMQAGIERYDPVKGGDNFSSRKRCETMAQKLPPAEIPPTRKPFLGLPPSSSKFAAVWAVSAVPDMTL